MTKLFDMENPVWRFMGKLTDMVLLTGLWVLTSLPVITIGASTTALYYVAMKLASNQEGYIIRDFFRSFRENMKQATALWLPALVLGIFFAGDLWWYYQIKTGIGVVIFVMFAVLTFVYLMTLLYLFPLLARCQSGNKDLLIMSFVMALKNFGWTILMLTITVCLTALCLFVCGPLIICAVGLCAYLHGLILNIVWKPYKLLL